MQIRFRFRIQRRLPNHGFLFGLVLYACASLHETSASAEGVERELVGAWAEPGNCDVTFVAKNGRWAFREPRDMGGLGFIVVENQYDGPFGQCSLSSITHQGDKDDLIHLAALAPLLPRRLRPGALVSMETAHVFEAPERLDPLLFRQRREAYDLGMRQDRLHACREVIRFVGQHAMAQELVDLFVREKLRQRRVVDALEQMSIRQRLRAHEMLGAYRNPVGSAEPVFRRLGRGAEISMRLTSYLRRPRD